MDSKLPRGMIKINEFFVCEYCGLGVEPLGNGSCRNHCPQCLSSKHVDISPGDRAATCHGRLRAVGYSPGGKKALRLLFRCDKCNYAAWNQAALDDPHQPDNYTEILKLSSVTPY